VADLWSLVSCRFIYRIVTQQLGEMSSVWVAAWDGSILIISTSKRMVRPIHLQQITPQLFLCTDHKCISSNK